MKITSGLFNFSDRLQMKSLEERNMRNNVLTANIANAETPGYRAFGYDFEAQLQELSGSNNALPLKATNGKHFRNIFTRADGTITPEVYVRPTESIGEDGNTVDIDQEMTSLANNSILFRTTVETLNRKTGILKYAINGGR